jgi:hypothetical protein
MESSGDPKLDTVNEKLDVINQNILALKNVIKEQDKYQRLAFAIENSQLGSFAYYIRCKPNGLGFSSRRDQDSMPRDQDSMPCTVYFGSGKQNSSELVKNILLSFRQGTAQCLSQCAIIDDLAVSCWLSENQANEAEQKFHDELVGQIYRLTGTKPRITKQENGTYAIFYS